MTDIPLCSVERKCSSTGRACSSYYRACQRGAIGDGLEITCERSEVHEYVYCPPGGQQRDSGIVWILMVIAVAVAAVGAIVSWIVLRRRLSE